MGKNNTNPKKIPCSRADVEKARREGRQQGQQEMASLMFMVLMDTFGWTVEGTPTCEHCNSTWAKVGEDGSMEPVEAFFCPSCGNPERGGVVNSKSLIELWQQLDKTVDSIEKGEIKVRDVQSVLGEYGLRIEQEH